jgi:hypothetical protein
MLSLLCFSHAVICKANPHTAARITCLGFKNQIAPIDTGPFNQIINRVADRSFSLSLIYSF